MKQVRPTKEAYKLFHDATIALSQIESNGIRVDVPYLKKAFKETTDTYERLKSELQKEPEFFEWRKRFGTKAKLTANNQLATVMFDILGHTRAKVVEKKSKRSDQESAGEAVFAEIVDLPFVKKWFKMKKLEKAIQTYFPGILRETHEGSCHPFFNLSDEDKTVVSYRGSSQRFNFQNIPNRNPMIAEIIRRCFIARDGRMLGEVDFSGAEVRCSACYNKDPNLIKYIVDPTTDMHRDIASDLFFLPIEFLIANKDWAKKSVRDWAKNRFVFPEFYGAIWFQQAADLWRGVTSSKGEIPGLGITLLQHMAKNGIKELGSCDPQVEPGKGTFARHVMEVERLMWNKRFPVYTQWKRDWWTRYQKNGYVQYLTGFVCSGVFVRNEVLNFAIQGSAFHWLLWSLVQIHKWLRKYKMKTCIVGQIHDSIVADIHPKEQDDFLNKCREVMTKDIVKHWPWIIVPLEVEADLAPVGGSWFDKKEVKFA